MPNIITTQNAIFASGMIRAATDAYDRGFARAFRRICEYFLFQRLGETTGHFSLALVPAVMYIKPYDLARPNLEAGMTMAMVHWLEYCKETWPEFESCTSWVLNRLHQPTVVIEIAIDTAKLDKRSTLDILRYLEDVVFWLRGSPLDRVVWDDLDEPETAQLIADTLNKYAKD